jgi:tRNA nucleotidyltransferase (CCA-adding enzyme)
VKPRIKVQDVMSRGVRTVTPDEPVTDVAQQMLQTGHEGFPVVNEDLHVIGLITRNAVDRALQHQLARQPVRRLMQPGEVSVTPSDSVERVRALMIQTGWGQIPVTEEGRVVGVVTRTDMIRLQPSARSSERQKIVHLMQEAIPAQVLALIRRIGEAAADAGYVIYFVGGLVRDLLLGQPIGDVDLVVEGDAIELGRVLAARYGGEIRSHRRFGTAKWLLPVDIWQMPGVAVDAPTSAEAPNLPPFIDLVTARTEFYEHPTALPMVSRSSIKQDLHRRDFTINTLAIRLDPQRWGELLDFYGGRADIEEGVIRVLHSLSFIDDPTRILRAARFEARLGFRIDARSASLIADAVPLLDRVTGERIRHELDLILQEASPEDVLARLEEFGALQQIHPRLVVDAWLRSRFERLRQDLEPEVWGLTVPRDIRLLHWALLTYRLTSHDFAQIRRRLKLPARLADLHHTRLAVLSTVEEISDLKDPGEVSAHLSNHHLVALALVWLTQEYRGACDKLKQYAAHWRHIQPSLDGNDLKALGFKPGPQYREILSGLQVARINGDVTSREEELAWVERNFGLGTEDA